MTEKEDVLLPQDEHPSDGDALSLLVAERLSQMMTAGGVPERQQAAFLSQLCGLSISQARRKLRGASWSFGEVLTLCRHYNASIDALFGLGEALTGRPTQEATFLVGEWTHPCFVRLGAQVSAETTGDHLVTAGASDGWYVGTAEQLLARGLVGSFYKADQVVLDAREDEPSTRIAVLDDEAAISGMLCDWFRSMGYEADPYTSAQEFLAQAPENYDAFIIDFVLAGGDSSQAIIEDLRRAMPTAPIILLTGKLRDGQASEASLATVLRTSNVRFFEKPIRPAVLAAAIESGLDEARARKHEQS